MDSQAKQKATHDEHAKFREFYPGDRVSVKDLRKEDTWWQGSIAERSGPKSYIIVLNDGRVWKRHVDHMRRDGMGRSASEPGGEREYQDHSLEVPWAIPVRSDISGQPQVQPDAQEGVSAETDSAQDQKQDVTPAVTAEAPATAPPQSVEAAPTPFRRSSRGRRAPDRLIESI